MKKSAITLTLCISFAVLNGQTINDGKSGTTPSTGTGTGTQQSSGAATIKKGSAQGDEFGSQGVNTGTTTAGKRQGQTRSSKNKDTANTPKNRP